MGLKAILFDAGDVIYHHPRRGRHLAAFLGGRGLSFQPQYRRLKRLGLLLGIVTNTYNATAEKMTWFRRFGIEGVWDAFVTSCEVGLCKPDRRIYLAALERLKVEPSRAAFVGHAASELEGAKSAGLTTAGFSQEAPREVADHAIANFSELLRLVKTRR